MRINDRIFYVKLLHILFILLFISLSILTLQLYNLFKTEKISQNPQVKQASSSAKIAPKNDTKNIQQIPKPSGKSVHVPILLYHYIGGNPNENDKARDALLVLPDKFDEQMGYLQKNGFNPITLDTMMAGLTETNQLPSKPVIITFDDGYIDLYYNAFGILRKYNFRAVAFIPTGLVGTSYYASWEQLSEMQASGLLSFQSHSVSHANLPSLSQDQLNMELTESKKTLEEKFGIPVNFIAYPYGTSNSTVWAAAQKTGYVGALGTWFSATQSIGTIYNMPRIKVSGNWDINQFISKL